MGFRFAACRLFLHLLLILVIWKHASASRDLLHDGHAHGEPQGHDHHHHNHHMMDHVVFFNLEDLQLGKTMPIQFPKKDPIFPSFHLLPQEEADKIPFSLKQLPNLLQFFSISQDSPQANAMKMILRNCEAKAIKGETKFCATSLESMLDFSRFILGPKIKVLSSTHPKHSATILENYTIVEVPQEIPASKVVACHTMHYPYAVFYCHSQNPNTSRLFKASLVGEKNGDRLEAISVCHVDTSQWNHDHLAFQVLGIEPGTSPVCHFFLADNFVWIPLPSTTI